jgi:hypothetical protein
LGFSPSSLSPTCAYYTPGNLKTTTLDIHIPEHKQKTKSNSAQY